MRAFINCAEPCRAETFRRFLARFAEWGVRSDMLQSCYAMAETVFCVSQTAPGSQPSAGMIGDPPHEAMALGRPIAGIDVAILDRDGNALPGGEVGEIALTGDFLFQGYFRDPELTVTRFRDGWYLSRDHGAIVDGAIHILGRADDMLIVNGRNLHAGEIEALIDDLGLTQPGRVVAFTEYDERIGGNGLVILAERLRPSPERDDVIIDRIVEQVRGALDIQPRAARLVPRGWIVKTTSGKIARDANRRKYQDRTHTTREAALAGS
jgi:fatty-acyl-CoA synthase